MNRWTWLTLFWSRDNGQVVECAWSSLRFNARNSPTCPLSLLQILSQVHRLTYVIPSQVLSGPMPIDSNSLGLAPACADPPRCPACSMFMVRILVLWNLELRRVELNCLELAWLESRDEVRFEFVLNRIVLQVENSAHKMEFMCELTFAQVHTEFS